MYNILYLSMLCYIKIHLNRALLHSHTGSHTYIMARLEDVYVQTVE